MLQLLGQEPLNIVQRWIIFIISYKMRSDGLFQVEYRYVGVVFMVKGNFLLIWIQGQILLLMLELLSLKVYDNLRRAMCIDPLKPKIETCFST